MGAQLNLMASSSSFKSYFSALFIKKKSVCFAELELGYSDQYVIISSGHGDTF